MTLLSNSNLCLVPSFHEKVVRFPGVTSSTWIGVDYTVTTHKYNPPSN